MLSGEGEPPESTDSEMDMVAKVHATPGAIGYVSRPEIKENVKVLLVISQD